MAQIRLYVTNDVPEEMLAQFNELEGVTAGEYEIQFKITTSAGYVHNHPELNVLKVKVVV